MAFVVEDGTGLDDANAYVSVEFVNDWHKERGNGGWTGGSGEKQKAIVRATDYIDQRFGRLFRGFREKKSQGLEWPRLDAFDDDDFLMSDIDRVPRQLEKACAEYALRALIAQPLAPDPQLPFSDRDTTGEGSTQGGEASGEISAKSEKVGPIEEKTEYKTTSEVTNEGALIVPRNAPEVSGFYIPVYPQADMWLAELLRPRSSGDLARA